MLSKSEMISIWWHNARHYRDGTQNKYNPVFTHFGPSYLVFTYVQPSEFSREAPPSPMGAWRRVRLNLHGGRSAGGGEHVIGV